MFEISEDAEEAFYAAFSIGSLDGMMQVWAPDDHIICIHPGGPRLAGVRDIRRSWAQIFQDSMPRTFTLRGRIVSGEGAQRIHLLEENIRVPGTTFVAPPVLATNIYRRLSQALAHGDAPRQCGSDQPEPDRPERCAPRQAQSASALICTTRKTH